ncbi:MAG TPA: hypothetical protein VK671_17830 [Mucilaginibacter sp.]|nr:hypothetical protein [Mucilaginibacter sp.]
MKGLPLILLKTVIISVIVSIAANCIYYAVITHSGDHDYGHAVPLIMERTFFLGIIIGVMSSPMLFLYHPNYWDSLAGRLLLYFAGPILFIISVFYVSTNPVTQTADLLTGAVFFIVNCIFYYVLTRKSQSGTTYRTRK